MSFNFTCPSCKQVMQCEDAWTGMEAQCPTCGKQITLAKHVSDILEVLPGPFAVLRSDATSRKISRLAFALVWGVILLVDFFYFYGIKTFFVLDRNRIVRRAEEQCVKMLTNIANHASRDIDIIRVEISESDEKWAEVTYVDNKENQGETQKFRMKIKIVAKDEIRIGNIFTRLVKGPPDDAIAVQINPEDLSVFL